MIKFNKHNVTSGKVKVNIWYSLDRRIDGRKCVTIYAKEYSGKLCAIFDNVENNTDSQRDYFEKDKVNFFEDHPLYATARAAAEAIEAARTAKYLKVAA